MFFPLMIVFHSVFSCAWSTPAAVQADFPAEISAQVETIRSERSRLRRLELFRSLSSDVKKRVGSLPENIEESDVPRVELLFELNVLFGGVKPETLNPANCPSVVHALRRMAGPSGGDDSQLSSSGRLVLDVVRSVCAP